MEEIQVVPGHARAEKLLQAAEQRLLLAFREAEASFKHMGDRGGAREAAVRAFLGDQLPSRFAVRQGEVMDAAGNTSGQTDILIYDSANVRSLTEAEGVVLLPAEALLAVVEVKSSLNKAEVDRVAAAAAKLCTLKPWDAPWTTARKAGEHADDGMPRIFATLFAFKTDLVEATWAEAEMNRIRTSCKDNDLPTAHLDRVVVLGRGMLIPSAGSAFTVRDDASVIGQWFYQLASFLARETDRREAFPWDRYRLPHRGAWVKVAEPLDDAPQVERATTVARLRSRNERNRRASGC